jgi:signal transduction histidine kinase
LDNSNRFIKIQISDNGSRIPETIQDKIFDVFFTTKKTGNGLGLAVCDVIIKNHGGIIKLDSLPEQ